MKQFLSLMLAFSLSFCGHPAFAEKGYDRESPRTQWFETLMQPDNPTAKCCGKADGYEADIYQNNGNGTWTVEITNGREMKWPDGTVRPGIPDGTKFIIPSEKVNPPVDGNPTGHAWLFLKIDPNTNQVVKIYCFVRLPDGS